MLRKSSKRPSGTVGPSDGTVVAVASGERVKKLSMAPLGSKRVKKDVWSSLEDHVFGGESEVMEEVDRILNGDSPKPTGRKVEQKKQPAWHDDDDDSGSIQVSKAKKFEVLRKGAEKKLPKSEYAQRLKSQFEKVVSTPEWAKLPSEREKKEDEDRDVEEMLKRTGTYLTSSKHLPQGMVDIKQCTDLNKEYPHKNQLTALEFHPSAQVALTGGLNNTMALFQVDGKFNSKIQSFHIEKSPVTCAHFTQDGEQIVMGTSHKSFKYFDMIAGKMVHVPMKGLEENNMKRFEVSPDGKYLVFLGSYGKMNFLSTKAKEWLFTLTMNGGVSAVTFSQDGRHMYSFGDEGQIYVYDLTTRDCIHRFMDDGCTKGSHISISRNNQYIACGSNTGVVNLYETEACLKSQAPKPLKAIMNLTSACSMLKFNATSEILAIGSSSDEKAVKLVHTASQTVFSNFPERINPGFTTATVLDFSVNSGYFTIGTSRGKALLYRLQHYDNY